MRPPPAPRAIESLNERLDPDDVSLRTLSGVRAVKCARLNALGEAAHRGGNERATNNDRLWVKSALHVFNQYGNGILYQNITKWIQRPWHGD